MATPNQLKDQLNRLRSTLLKTNLQQTNQPLFQVINTLIDSLFASINTAAAASSGSGGGGALSDQPYLTSSNALVALPFSRQLIAGTNISFDDSVFGERTVNVPDPPDREWSVLTTGDVDNPELVFAGGQVIMLHTP